MKTLHLGDCLEVLRFMPSGSVDSIVTDPPYGLTQKKKGGSGVASVNLESPYGRARIGTGNGEGGFMGLKWDSDVPSTEVWAECLRVLKPGGHLLAFAGTRTQHRMAVRIEDAGFEIRDMIAWVYGSGFPKSHNLQGDWQGWGTALKPAMEPITVARKPLAGTVAENVLAHGTGALNIDATRIPTDTSVDDPRLGGKGTWCTGKMAKSAYGEFAGAEVTSSTLGRWPANLIHDGSEEVLAGFPQAPGQQGALTGDEPSGKLGAANTYGKMDWRHAAAPRGDTGSAARFFYCAKASKRDRDDGNIHPTVKPTDLMRYLCRMVTPPGGVVLDPFMGSGSTGKAAILEGFRFIGIERESAYFEIACARIKDDDQMSLL